MSSPRSKHPLATFKGHSSNNRRIAVGAQAYNFGANGDTNKNNKNNRLTIEGRGWARGGGKGTSYEAETEKQEAGCVHLVANRVGTRELGYLV